MQFGAAQAGCREPGCGRRPSCVRSQLWPLTSAGSRSVWQDQGLSHHEDNALRLILAIFLPFLAFFTIGRPIAGIVCLILQITLIGWLPAAI